jgi:hypothetical protein
MRTTHRESRHSTVCVPLHVEQLSFPPLHALHAMSSY